MRVSLALEELKISFELLQEYGKLLEVDISTSFDISEELLEQVKDLNSHEPTRIKLSNITIDKVVKKIGAYREGDHLKMLARIKWFGDEAKNGDYGFLEVPGFDDVFFHYKQVNSIPRGDLRPEKTVVISFSETNLFIDKKKSVTSVSSLESEKDILFIFHCFSLERALRIYQFNIVEVFNQFIRNLDNYSKNFTDTNREEFVNEILKLLKDKSFSVNLADYFSKLLTVFNNSEYKSKQINRIAEISECYILKSIYIFREWSFILSFREFCGIPMSLELQQYIIESISDKDKLFWWSKHNLNIPVTQIIDELAELLSSSPFEQEDHLKKLSPDNLKMTLSKAWEKIVSDKANQYSSNNIGNFLKLSFQHKQNPDISHLGNDKLFNLWNNGYIEYFPLDAVREYLKLKRYDQKTQIDVYNKKEDKNNIKLLLTKLNIQEFRDIVSAIWYEGEKIRTTEQFQEFSFIIENLGIKEAKEKGLIDLAYDNSADFYKLMLFISDFTDKLNYDDLVIYTGLLDATKQKLFFKRIIKLIEENKVKLTLEDLSRITAIDYETSEYAKEIDGVGLDFSLSIVLRLINDLKNEEITKAETIYDIVAKQIKKPDDLLVIEGFFEKCPGRMILKKNTDPDVHIFERNLERRPRFATFCDGRKANDKSTGKASHCQTSGKEFWWCENSKCYETARKPNTSQNWKSYSLEDILRVLEINYNSTQYEVLLGLINRVNRFLKHLSCRSCKKILKPVDKGNYGFYRVSNFQCPDPDCKEHNEVIYLSHCANGACEDIIDSRDSVKCKPEGHHQTCGWYICNNCFACCSTEKLKGRIYAFQMTGQEYKCHTEGHKNRQLLCCTKCGSEMEEHEQHGSLFKKQLEWFIDQKSKHNSITRFGKRNDGKWWFVWSQGSFSYEEFRKHLKTLYKSGFNIPDYNDPSKTSQLIAEPYRESKAGLLFSCKECSHIYKLTDLAEFDYARQNSILKFHDWINIKQIAK